MSESPYDLDAEARRRWRSGKVDGATAATILKHYDEAYLTLRAERDSLRALAVRLAEGLTVARSAINTMDEDALGIAYGTGDESWPIKAEVLSKLDAALSDARAAGLIDAKKEELANRDSERVEVVEHLTGEVNALKVDLERLREALTQIGAAAWDSGSTPAPEVVSRLYCIASAALSPPDPQEGK